MEWIWSYLLVGVGLIGFVLAGQKKWYAWYVNFFCQFLWLAYAVLTQQWGFIVGALVYAVVFGRNAVKWTEDMRKNKVIKERVAKYASEVEMVDEGILVNGHFTRVPDGQVVYEDRHGVISVGPVVPPGHKRVGSFYQH